MTDDLFKTIEDATRIIVGDSCNLQEVQSNVALVSKLLSETTEMDFESVEQAVGSNHTDKGVALSPMLAAGCASSHTRTQQFQRGINQYLTEKKEQLISQNDEPLNILYAGTGPYATLLFPLLLLHQDININLTAIDIFDSSIKSVARLFEKAKLHNVSLKTYTANATKWRPDSDTQTFDLIISETMDRGLMREPQVSVFKHLIQFLKPEGSLIPEEIQITATLVNGNDFCPLGTVFSLNKNTSNALLEQDKDYFEGKISIPEEAKQKYSRLVISTEINTFGKHFIRRNEIEITTDFSFRYLDLSERDAISYKYKMDENPGFVFSLHYYQAPPPPESLNIQTISQTPYLYVFWQDILWNFHKPRQEDQFKDLKSWINWDNVTLMMDAYNADLQTAIQHTLDKHPPCFERFESWFLDTFGKLSDKDSFALNQSIALSHKQH